MIACGACRGELASEPTPGTAGLHLCGVCGCWNRLPRPTPEAFLRPVELDPLGVGAGPFLRDVEKFVPVLERVEEIGRFGRGEDLYDVGCYWGPLLWLARLRGWERPQGCDVNGAACQLVRDLFGLPAHCGHFEQAPVEPESQDVVVFHHGIEHVLDPRACLLKAHTILRPGGLVYLRHPRIPSPELVAERADRSTTPGGHLYEWTFEAFERFVQSLGPIFVIRAADSHSEQEWILRKVT